MLLLAALASAHVPHDTVLALVAPEDADPSVPWFILLDPQGKFLWARSDDAGATWALTGGAPLAEAALGAARLQDGTLGILGDEHLWISTDDGTTWSPETIPGAADSIRGGPLFELAGAGGLFVGVPDDWTPITLAPITRLGPGAAYAPSEGLWVESFGVWTRLPSPEVTPEALTSDGESYVGSVDGVIQRWDGAAWTDCAALPDPPDADHDNVVQLLATAGTLYVATGSAAPYVAPTTCGTYATDALAPITIDYGSDGGAATERAAWTGLARLGDTLALTGWAGLALSPDDGATWTEPQLVPPDYTRGIAFSATFPEDPRIWVGAYASGVQLTDDGGVSWRAPNHGIGTTNAQWVVPAPSEPDVVYAIVNHVGWRSTDDGETWTEFTPGGSSTGMIWPMVEPGRVFQLATSLYETRDAGVTWTERTDITATLAGATPAGLTQSGAILCVTAVTPSGLFCSADDGATWTPLQTGAEDGIASAPRLWPPAAPTRAIWVDDAGAHAVNLDGTAPVDTVAEPFSELAMTADGTLIAGANSGLLYTSVDGGDTWTALATRLPAYIHVIAPRPDWEAHPEVLVGTHDGVYVVTLDGRAERLAYQRLDDRSFYLACTGCSALDPDPLASMDSIQPLDEGAQMTAEVRGSRLVLTGSAEEGAAFALRVDGTESTVGPLPSTSGVLVELTLADGHHQLQLTGLAGPQVRIDTLEAFGDGPTLQVVDPPMTAAHTVTAVALSHDTGDSLIDTGDTGTPDPRDCGCGDGRSALLLVGSALLRRRRR